MRQTRSAGILLLRVDDGAILLARRSGEVHNPGWWSIPGGRLKPGETDFQGACREFREEMGSLPRMMHVIVAAPTRVFGGVYTTIAAEYKEYETDCWEPQLNWENDDWGWFYTNDLPSPLHPGVVAFIKTWLEV